MDRKMFTIAGLLLIPLLVAASCQVFSIDFGNTVRGSGKIETETREASAFDEISVCCGMQLLLTQGHVESLVIEADDNLLPEISSTVVGGRLEVRYKNETTQYRPTKPVVVRVSAVEVKGLEVSGGGRLEAQPLVTDDLEIELSGGSQADLGTVQADSLHTNVSGGGSFQAADLQVGQLVIELSGGSEASVDSFNGDRLDFDASGGGDSRIAGSVAEQITRLGGGAALDAGNLQSQSATIKMSGGGSSTLWVTGTLDADLSGGANLDYYGSPVVTQQLSGGSDIQSKGEK